MACTTYSRNWDTRAASRANALCLAKVSRVYPLGSSSRTRREPGWRAFPGRPGRGRSAPHGVPARPRRPGTAAARDPPFRAGARPLVLRGRRCALSRTRPPCTLPDDAGYDCFRVGRQTENPLSTRSALRHHLVERQVRSVSGRWRPQPELTVSAKLRSPRQSAASRARRPVSRYCGHCWRASTLRPRERQLIEGANWRSRPLAVLQPSALDDSLQRQKPFVRRCRAAVVRPKRLHAV